MMVPRSHSGCWLRTTMAIHLQLTHHRSHSRKTGLSRRRKLARNAFLLTVSTHATKQVAPTRRRDLSSGQQPDHRPSSIQCLSRGPNYSTVRCITVHGSQWKQETNFLTLIRREQIYVVPPQPTNLRACVQHCGDVLVPTIRTCTSSYEAKPTYVIRANNNLAFGPRAPTLRSCRRNMCQGRPL